MRQKLFSIGEDFWIETDAGEPAYKVDGQALSFHNTFILEDASGAALLKAGRELLQLRETMEIERDGSTVATIKKAMFVLLGERFEIELGGGGQLTATGSISNHEYRIERGGTTIATISRHWFTLPQTFGIEIADGEDDALLLAISACIDEMSQQRR
jgi:uncharacterized protein YxjI